MYYQKMKILSSSPYATFNPKEWNSLSRANLRFSSTPIKIKKKYLSKSRNMNLNKVDQVNNDLPRQIQLALT